MKHILLTLVLFATTHLLAHDFEVDGIYYNIISEEDMTVGVTYQGGHYNSYQGSYSDSLIIPMTVEYDGTVYNVKSIEEYAFYNCEDLISITIPNSITNIKNNAFDGCNGLKELSLEDGNEDLTLGYSYKTYKGDNKYAYGGLFLTCPLEKVYLGRNLKHSYDLYYATGGVFYEKKIKVLEISEYVTSISSYAFYNCPDLLSVIIPSSVKVVGTSAFNKVTKVIFLTNTKPIISSDAFSGCEVYYTASSDAYSNVSGEHKVYPLLSSMFNVDGVIYVPTSMSNRTCDMIEVDYSAESINSHIGPLVTYTNSSGKQFDFSVEKVNMYAGYQCKAFSDLVLKFEGEIEQYAFYGSSATSIDIDSTITTVGGLAFGNCKTASSIMVANKGDIEGGAFSGCIGATSIIVINEGNINSVAFSGCMTKEEGAIVVSNNGDISYKAFSDCTSATTINVSNNGAIGEGAFSECMQTNEGIIKVSNKGDIGAGAFTNCRKATLIDINNEGNIGESAFSGCSAAKSIVVSNNVGTIGESAFSGCMSEIEGIIMLSNKGDIRDLAFSNCKNAGLIDIMNIGVLGTGAFKGCSGAKTINIGDEITSIGDDCFSNCSSVENMKLSKKITSIGSGCFSSCSGMVSIEFNDIITNISSYAFSGCNSLASLSIPANVAMIESGAFDYCTSIVDLIFEDCDSLISIACKFESGKNLYLGRDIVYSMGNASPFSENKVLSKVTTNMNVTNVLDYEFYNCKNLKDVYLSDEVTKIGKYAFSGDVALESFEVGVSVNEIGAEAFSDCTGLIDFTSHAWIPASVGTESLDDINKLECTLHVPQGSEDLYMEADQWKEFYIEGDLSQRHKVIISVDQECIGMGTTIGTNGYNEGSEATIKAIPNELYRFVEWNDGNKENPRTIIVTDFINLTAKFAYKYYISTQPTANDISVELNEELTDVEYNWFVYKSGELAKHLDGESTNKVSGSALEIGYFYYCMISFPDGTILKSKEVQYSDINAINKVAADSVIAKINVIGTVVYTDSCKTKIEEARKAYDKLTDDQKKIISEVQLKVLTDAEETFEKLEKESEKIELDKELANLVIEKINDIGIVVYSDLCFELIENARNSYEELSDDQKALISENQLKILTDAEQKYAVLKDLADNVFVDTTDGNAYKFINTIPTSKTSLWRWNYYNEGGEGIGYHDLNSYAWEKDADGVIIDYNHIGDEVDASSLAYEMGWLKKTFPYTVIVDGKVLSFNDKIETIWRDENNKPTYKSLNAGRNYFGPDPIIRPDEGVDLYIATCLGTDYELPLDVAYSSITMIEPGEWVKYTVDVKKPGYYKISGVISNEYDYHGDSKKNEISIFSGSSNILCSTTNLDDENSITSFGFEKLSKCADPDIDYRSEPWNCWGVSNAITADEKNVLCLFKKEGIQQITFVFNDYSSGIGPLQFEYYDEVENDEFSVENDVKSNNIDFLIYPNPTSSEFTVVVSEKTKVTIEISNAFGQIIESRDIEGTTTINKMLVSGVYTITLKTQGEVIIKKLIVK